LISVLLSKAKSASGVALSEELGAIVPFAAGFVETLVDKRSINFG
jgi:hypothetical protein